MALPEDAGELFFGAPYLCVPDDQLDSALERRITTLPEGIRWHFAAAYHWSDHQTTRVATHPRLVIRKKIEIGSPAVVLEPTGADVPNVVGLTLIRTGKDAWNLLVLRDGDKLHRKTRPLATIPLTLMPNSDTPKPRFEISVDAFSFNVAWGRRRLTAPFGVPVE